MDLGIDCSMGNIACSLNCNTQDHKFYGREVLFDGVITNEVY